MSLICICGDVGTGKTTLATYLAKGANREVYANYTIRDERFHQLEPHMLAEVEDAVVVIDEAYIWLEARTSSKDLNRFLSYILFQSRKKRIDIILTQQLFGTVDVRFREMADYVILATRDGRDFHYKVLKQSVTNPVVKDFVITYEDALKIFPFYDTLEKIPFSNDLLGASVVDKESLRPEIDAIADDLLSRYDGRKITKAIIADICLAKRYPKQYVDLIYNNIKAKAFLKG